MEQEALDHKSAEAQSEITELPKFTNPFRPGAGHMPPYLAGRQEEQFEFKRLLGQSVILENLLLTGLRGVGKTVLLETFKPVAIQENWLWVGTEFSESVGVSEDHLAVRILLDLSVVTSGITLTVEDKKKAGFIGAQKDIAWDFKTLKQIYEETPGLVSDKLKRVLEAVWGIVARLKKKGIVFAYDEAQTLRDNATKEQYPLSLLLDVFQSLQRKGISFMLALTGLPTLFPKLVEARTYSERMFRVIFLDKLTMAETRKAILTPIEVSQCPVRFDNNSIDTICLISGGYPYFIQFICKEVYDKFIQQSAHGVVSSVPVNEIIKKLDADFFAGRWALVTDRQKDLLRVIAQMPNSGGEFTVQEIVNASQTVLKKPFANSRVSAILVSLMEAGLIYKNRHGKYRFAVPMFTQFIQRHIDEADGLLF
jgi:hypothetical protein